MASSFKQSMVNLDDLGDDEDEQPAPVVTLPGNNAGQGGTGLATNTNAGTAKKTDDDDKVRVPTYDETRRCF